MVGRSNRHRSGHLTRTQIYLESFDEHSLPTEGNCPHITANPSCEHACVHGRRGKGTCSAAGYRAFREVADAIGWRMRCPCVSEVPYRDSFAFKSLDQQATGRVDETRNVFELV